MYYLFICLFSVEIMTDFRYPPRSDCVACAYKTSHESGEPVPFSDRIWDWLKNNRRNNDTIAMSPKTIEATGEENESKYRSGRGTGVLSMRAGYDGKLKRIKGLCRNIFSQAQFCIYHTE